MQICLSPLFLGAESKEFRGTGQRQEDTTSLHHCGSQRHIPRIVVDFCAVFSSLDTRVLGANLISWRQSCQILCAVTLSSHTDLLIKNIWVRFLHSHFTDDNTEVPKLQKTC